MSHLRIVDVGQIETPVEEKDGFPWRRLLVFVGIAAGSAAVSFYVMRMLSKMHEPPVSVRERQLDARVANLEMLIAALTEAASA